MSAKKTIPFSMRFDPELKRELQQLADQDHRALANYIEKVLRDHIEALKPKEFARRKVSAARR